MLTSIVIVSFVALLIGMAISVAAFGTGGKRSKVFQDIYFSVEDVDGIGVVYTKMGEYSAILRMTNPVKKFSADVDSYYQFTSLLGSVIETLGEGYALHKQDIFVRRRFSKSAGEGAEQDDVRYLTAAYFRAFEGREYIDNDTYLVITQESRKNSLLSYDNARWKDFLLKIQKVYDLLHDGGVRVRFLDSRLARLYIDRFFAVNFRDKVFSMTDFKVDSEHILMGDRQCKMYSLLDVDNVGLPGFLRPYADMTVNNTVMPVDLMADLDQIPGVETVVYNQVFFLPNQKRELSLLEKKKNRHASIPNPGNAMAAEDIKKVQEVIARESRQLVYAHYNLLVSIPSDGDMQKVTNYLENSFSRRGIHISKRAYNQLELFIASFPGNVFRLNQDYDRFLTLSDAAMCLTYKECPTKGDTGKNFPHCYYTDRDGVPMAVDITGKEADIRRTDNSNFFALGPSGSGKSFFMNTVVRQLYEQNTDIVIVDTGDSYEMLCQQFGGTYISYSKESPISMNPFKVSRLEYEENFVEKKDFLKSLIFLIFKGAGEVSKIEEYIIEKTIMEYYREYFTPFKGYSDQERKELHDALVITAQSNGEFDDFEERLNVANGTGRYDITEEDRAKFDKTNRLREKLQSVVQDSASAELEKANAAKALQRLTPELVEGKFLQTIEREITRREQQRKRLRVTELSFNSYYEYARQRIPQIMREDNVEFPINNFAAILKPFYKGGVMEYTLNNDMDSSLFDERFIVFEIDKVKDDKALFPIIVLIIMDVFTQKMRIKSDCRKCLVIEEAWKAIATPVMAEYIKYLYKTARKHWAMVGVVTQEIQDIVSSPIVKDAIISNSGVFMLLDQSKFKDKFDDIKSTLALTDIDCKKIFTINRLDNKANRMKFKEVFIKRGQDGDVFGIEEPRECYMNYTTEKVEKEALKLYKRELKCSHREAVEAFIRDWIRSGIQDSQEFSKRIKQEGRVLNLPPAA